MTMNWLRTVTVAAILGCALPAAAKDAVSCGGAAMLGGAQLNCSHVEPKAPPQFCTFSWALHTPAGGQQVVEGSFMLPPGAQRPGLSGQRFRQRAFQSDRHLPRQPLSAVGAVARSR